MVLGPPAGVQLLLKLSSAEALWLPLLYVLSYKHGNFVPVGPDSVYVSCFLSVAKCGSIVLDFLILSLPFGEKMNSDD